MAYIPCVDVAKSNVLLLTIALPPSSLQLKIDPEDASAEHEDSSHPARHATEEGDSSYWLGPSGQKTSEWEVDLCGSHEVSSVTVLWARDQNNGSSSHGMPEKFEVLAAPEPKAAFELVTTVTCVVRVLLSFCGRSPI